MSAASPLPLAAIAVGGVLLLLSPLYALGNRRIAERETEIGARLPPSVPGRLIEVDGHREHIVERGAARHFFWCMAPPGPPATGKSTSWNRSRGTDTSSR